MKNNFKKILILIFVGVFFNTLVKAQLSEFPNNIQDISVEKIGNEMARVLEEESIPIWKNVLNWLNSKIWQPIKVWIFSQFQPQSIEEEYQREKEEIKKELPGVEKSLWDRFKELIK